MYGSKSKYIYILTSIFLLIPLIGKHAHFCKSNVLSPPLSQMNYKTGDFSYKHYN